VELTHNFTVPAGLDQTWTAFNDIESVAGCFPGATVTSVEGDDFKGSCKVKLGPISLVYAGTGTFLEKDESAHRFVIEAKGKDKRGNGTAGATVTATMTAAGGDATDVSVFTDLHITGKPAQFGRGVMQDVSDKLLQQFATCLESRLGGGPGPAPAAPAGGTVETTPIAEEAASAAAMAAGGDEAGHVHPDDVAARQVSGHETLGGTAAGGPSYAGGEAEPENVLDLGTTVLPVIAKAYWKPVLGAVLVLLVLRRLLRRRG
jgi:uncharacterized protein